MPSLSPADRDRETSDAVEQLLTSGNVLKAIHASRGGLVAEYQALAREDPARAALLGAALAGQLAEIAATLRNTYPRKPPGYTGGPPTAQHLLAAYETARNETRR